RDIWNYNIDTKHFIFWKHQARIEYEHVFVNFDNIHIFGNFTNAAERNDFHFFFCLFFVIQSVVLLLHFGYIYLSSFLSSFFSSSCNNSLRDAFTRPWLSMFVTLTSILSPTLVTSSTLLTRAVSS